MSRIVLTRHPNGEEHIVAGWDRPLSYYFADRYDEDGEPIETRGYISGETNLSPRQIEAIVRGWGATHRGALADVLAKHSTLEYPASNRVED